MPPLQGIEVGSEGCRAAQALAGQLLPGGLNQHHPAAETPSWLLVSGRKLGGENTTQFLELAGKVVSASRRVGFLVMDPGGADQGGSRKGPRR